MSRNKDYQKLLNSKRWIETKRIVWQRANGLCERCREEGYVRSGVDVHHIVPVERGKSLAEMERLCYNPDNCRLLCIKCHIKTHMELKSFGKENVKANRERDFERWKAKVKGLTYTTCIALAVLIVVLELIFI